MAGFRKHQTHMTEKDIKLLWGRAGNRCSKCRCLVSQDSQSGSGYVLGEQAHIVGEKTHSPRGQSSLSTEERESYHNRILLCPTDHTEIDKNVAEWPVEKLHLLKSTHELWVFETLADSADLHMVARRVALASVIDWAVTLCHLEGWREWTRDALSADPIWAADYPDDFDEFRQRVGSMIWPPDNLELATATRVLALTLHQAATNFLEHATFSGTRYLPDKFYQRPRPNPTYERDLAEYTSWLSTGWGLVRRATKAANWFADLVRRDINPAFFAERGRFSVLDDASPYGVGTPQFSQADKMALMAGESL
jgi:hypothetical protein